MLPVLLATLVRFAVTEKSVWLPILNKLFFVARGSLDADLPLPHGALSAEDWGGEAYVVTLAWAYKGFPTEGYGQLSLSSTPSWAGHIVTTRIKKEARGHMEKGRIRFRVYGDVDPDKPGTTLQAFAKECFRKELAEPTTLPEAWKKRAIDWFGIFPEQWDIVDQTRLLCFVRALPLVVAAQVIRTWSFAWLTARRFHDRAGVSCILGCEEGGDAQEHYLCCPAAWHGLQKFTGHRVSTLQGQMPCAVHVAG